MNFSTPFPAPDELATGGHVSKELTNITISFDTVHYSLSTSPLNGGFTHTLGIRNQQLTFYVDREDQLPGGSVSQYLASEFEMIDMPVHFCTALLTSASMEKHIYTKVKESDCIVETIITAGLDKTAHRAGDGYFYEEKNGTFHGVGTINILVFTNKALTQGAMVKAMITITEAKAAVLQELGIYDIESEQIATGSATDGVVLTINTEGEILSDAGSFSLFGDTLAKAVRQGLQKALTLF